MQICPDRIQIEANQSIFTYIKYNKRKHYSSINKKNIQKVYVRLKAYIHYYHY